MKKYLIVIILFCTSCSNEKKITKETNVKEKEIDTLEYFYHQRFRSVRLLLFKNKNFEFQFSDFGCLPGSSSITDKVIGEYNVNNSKLILFPKKNQHIYSPFEIEKEIKKTETKYNPDSLKIKTEYDIINWGNSSCLLSPKVPPLKTDKGGIIVDGGKNDYHNFAKIYNSSYDSKASNNEPYLKMSSKNPWVKEDLNDLLLKDTSFKWKELFLIEPIITQITEIHLVDLGSEYKELKSARIRNIKIDKGSIDNVKKGMFFRNKSGDFAIKISSVTETNSFGSVKFDHLKKGTTIKKGTYLQTKWK